MRVPFINTWLVLTAMAAALAGCSGGGSGCGTGITPIGGSSSGASGCPTTPVDTTPKAADLIVTVATSKATGIQNTGSDTATVTVTAVDSSRNIVPGVTVTIAPDDTAVVTASSTKTDANGVVTGVIGLGSDRSNRMIAVTIKSGTVTKAVNIPVTGAQLTATAPALISPGGSGTIEYRLVDAVGAAIAGVPITISGAATGAGTTDVNGGYSFAFTASTTPQQLQFDAAAAGVSTTNLVIDATTNIPPATGPVVAASLQVTPSTIGINANGSTSNHVDVRALFYSNGSAPVPNVRVRFDLDGDKYNIGGSLVAGPDTIVYSDANGVARTTYIPGSRSSGNQAFTLRGCWSLDDFPEVTPAGAPCPNGHEITQSLTVADEAVSLTVTTDGLLSFATNADQSLDTTTYQQAYTVQIVDSNSNPKAGVLVTGTAYLPRYYYGELAYNGVAWVDIYTAELCNNENIRRNNVIDVFSTTDPTQTEDENGNGVLDPAGSDVVIVPKAVGSNITDENGRAHFYMQYGRNHGGWDDFELTFAASVSGSEGRKVLTGKLPRLADDVTAKSTPAFQVSPYGSNVDHITGLQLTPTRNDVTDPDSGTTVKLCTAPH